MFLQNLFDGILDHPLKELQTNSTNLTNITVDYPAESADLTVSNHLLEVDVEDGLDGNAVLVIEIQQDIQ